MGRIIYRCTDRGACGSNVLDGINEYVIGYYNDNGERKRVFVPYFLIDQEFDTNIMDYPDVVVFNKEYVELIDFEKYFDYFKPICDLEDYEPVEYNDCVKYNSDDYIRLHLRSGDAVEYCFKKIGSKYSMLQVLDEIKNQIYNISLDDEEFIEDIIEQLTPIANSNFTAMIDDYDTFRYDEEDREKMSTIAKKQILYLEKVSKLSYDRDYLYNAIDDIVLCLESKYEKDF